MSTPRLTFTLDVLGWRPWVETVDDVGISPEQEALLEEVVPATTGRPYYATLAHDVPALRERTKLFKAIMYGAGGVRRADRELAAVSTARVNGCVYCASVHARLFAQLTKDVPAVQRLLDEGVEVEQAERERAVIDYAVKLTREPDTLTADDLAPLRKLGLSDGEILDISHATAMFAWANRLMQTLGEPERPAAAPG
ncbi:MAG: peroxidase-related enzyme [Chloroflexota bacterium]|nr:peroxidase-related enzyme [Chloroflexota bacterium]